MVGVKYALFLKRNFSKILQKMETFSLEKRLNEVKTSLDRQLLIIGTRGFDPYLFASIRKDYEWLQQQIKKPCDLNPNSNKH